MLHFVTAQVMVATESNDKKALLMHRKPRDVAANYYQYRMCRYLNVSLDTETLHTALGLCKITDIGVAHRV